MQSTDAGLPTPEYYEQNGYFCVKFKFKEPIITTVKPFEMNTQDLELTKQQQRILSLLKEKRSLTRREIMSYLESPIPERTLKRELNRLKELGFIDSEGQGKALVWLCK